MEEGKGVSPIYASQIRWKLSVVFTITRFSQASSLFQQADLDNFLCNCFAVPFRHAFDGALALEPLYKHVTVKMFCLERAPSLKMKFIAAVGEQSDSSN